MCSWILAYVWPKYSTYSDTAFFVGFYLGVLFAIFLSRAASARYKTTIVTLINIIFWIYLAENSVRALSHYSIGIWVNIVVGIYFFKSEAFE